MTVERINPDGVGSPDQWLQGAGTTKWQNMFDALDSTTIFTAITGFVNRFTMANPTAIVEADTINFITMHTRARRTAESGQSRIRMRVFDDATTFLDDNNIILTNSLVDYTSKQFPNTPGGGAWTLTDLNNMDIQMNAVSIPSFTFLQVVEYFVEIDYTPAATRRIFISNS